jgi:hypothetical protein
VTRHPGRLQPGPSDSAGHRQKIAAIEFTISTTMPGKIGLEALKQFAEFQSCCHSQSRQATRSREEIVYYLTLFCRHYDDILRKTEEMNVLLDQERFRHKRLDLPTDNIVSIRG